MPSPRISWTAEMERTLLKVLLNQANNGRRAEKGFKKEAWIAAENAVQHLCPTLTHSQAKNKHDSCKLKWQTWLNIGEQSGFVWDEVTQLYQAEDDVWARYIASHPEGKSLRFIPLQNRDVMADLFNTSTTRDNSTATRSDAQGIRRSRQLACQRAASPNLPVSTRNPPRRFTGEHVIAASIDRIGEQLEKNRAGQSAREESQQSLISRAIRLLETEYDGRLSEDGMQLAIDLFTDTVKADVFLSLMAGSRRDRWLQTSIGTWTPPVMLDSPAADADFT